MEEESIATSRHPANIRAWIHGKPAKALGSILGVGVLVGAIIGGLFGSGALPPEASQALEPTSVAMVQARATSGQVARDAVTQAPIEPAGASNQVHAERTATPRTPTHNTSELILAQQSTPQPLSLDLPTLEPAMTSRSSTIQPLEVLPTAAPPAVEAPSPGFAPVPVPTPAPAVLLPPSPAPGFRLVTGINKEVLGSVGVIPAEIDLRYLPNTQVVVNAACDFGFVRWEGNLSEGADPLSPVVTVTIDRDRVLVAVCHEPPVPSAPVATSTPTPAPSPGPTRLPYVPLGPRYILSINGAAVPPLQRAVETDKALVLLGVGPNLDGKYRKNEPITLTAYPARTGATVVWGGTDLSTGNTAIVHMTSDRSINVAVTYARRPSNPRSETTPVALASPTPTPTGSSGLRAASTPTPSPQPEVTSTPTPRPVPTPTAVPSLEDMPIAFTSDRDGNAEIYLGDIDGSGTVRLTYDSASDIGPKWSPDAAKIAFISTRDGNGEVYMMNPDGSGQSNLTNHIANDSGQDWNPISGQIVFTSDRDGPATDIYVMDSDGSNVVRLTNSSSHDDLPAVSPTGQNIAFRSGRDGNDEIYLMNPDGSGQVRLTNNSGSDSSPAWSPDGSRIAFASDRDGNFEIYTMSPDGTSQVRLTNSPASDFSPAWSPDGNRIVFHTTRDGNDEIYVMYADGSGQTNLSAHGSRDYQPNWRP